MSNHTPGPWHVAQPSPRIYSREIRDAGEMLIATVWSPLTESIEQIEANAHVMAAAPGLLAAAQAVLLPEAIESNSDEYVIVSLTVEEWQAIRDAVAKAKGES